MTFTVSNSGQTTSGTVSATIGGTDAAQFKIASNGCADAIEGGKNCTIKVSFTPASDGAKTATLTVAAASAETGGTATASLTGTGKSLPPAALTISSNMQDYGSVAIGQSSQPATFTVNNTGGSPSGVPTAALSGTNAADFVITGNGCASAIGADKSCTVSVKFAPSAMGNKTAVLTIAATPGGSVTVTLTGQATGVQALAISPTPNDFGPVVTGQTSTDATFTVTNTSNVSTGTITASITGGGATQFAVGTNGCTTLAAGATCTVTARFSPTSIGAKAASLTVTSSPGGTASAAMTGSGISPATLSISPNFQDYGQIPTGTTSSIITFNVTNTGGVATTALTAALGGTNSAAFTLAGNSCGSATLAPLASCSVGVKFAPTATGAAVAELTVSASATVTSKATLNGEGVAPAALSLTPTPHDFLSSPVGQASAAQTFTVTNTGSTNSGTINASVTGSNPSEFAIIAGGNGCLAATLTPGGTCTITVAFTPSAAGARSASLNVTASPGGTRSAALSGTGLVPATLSVNPNAKDFGSVVNGSASATVTFTVTNSGGVASGTPTVLVGGTNPSQFVINAPGCTAPVAAGGTCTFSMQFQPTALGSKAATVTVSGTPGGSVIIPLTGESVSPADIAVTPTPQAFGTALNGSLLPAATLAPLEFTVKNNGGLATGAITYALTGANADQFQLVAAAVPPTTPPACVSGTTSLAAGASCRIGMRFAPTTSGAKIASLEVTGVAGGTAVAALSGTGINQSTVAPTGIFNYASKALGTTTSQAFVWTNTSTTVAVALTGAQIGGANADQFAISGNTCNVSVPALGTCTVTLDFKPTLKANSVATLSLLGAGVGGADVANVTGTGISALSIVGNPVGSENWGNVTVNTLVNKTFDVTCAVGSGGCGMTTTTLSGLQTEYAVVTDACAGVAVGAGVTCSIVVTFFPATIAAGKNAKLSLVSRTYAGNATEIDLTGAGVSADTLSLAATTAFPTDQYLGSPVDRTITITNTAAVTANLDGADVGVEPDFTIAGAAGVGGGSANFAPKGGTFPGTGGTCAATLAAGSSCTVVVTYTPTLPATPIATTLKLIANPGTKAAGIYSTLTGAAVTPLSISPSTGFAFPDQVSTTASAPQVFTITNNGAVNTGVLTVDAAIDASVAPEIVSPAPTNFAATTNCVVLTPAQTCTISVTFTPGANGERGPAKILVHDAATGREVYATRLTGKGKSAAVAPTLVITPTTGVGTELDFGAVAVGVTTQTRTYTVTNSGDTATANLLAPVITDNNAAQATFALDSNTCTVGSPLASKANCTITGHFLGIGALAAVTSNVKMDDGTTSATAYAKAKVVVAANAKIGPTPDSFTQQWSNAAGTGTNGTTQTKIYQITNTSGGAIEVGMRTLSNTTDFAFGLTAATTCPMENIGACPAGGGNVACELANNASCNIEVIYKPQTTGSHTTNVSITTGGAPYASLYGTAIKPPFLATTPGTLVFTSIAVGLEEDKNFTVTNTGEAATVGAVTAILGGTSPQHFAINSNGCTAALAPAATCTISMKFKPTSQTQKLATLTLSTSNAPSTTQVGNLDGTGLEASVLSMDNPGTHAFGAKVIGDQTADFTYTITNLAGAATSGPISYTITGPNAADFTVNTGGSSCYNATTPVTLAGGVTCEYKARFKPLTAGAAARSAVLTVVGAPGGTLTRDLTGVADPSLTLIPGGSNPWAPTQPAGGVTTETFTLTNKSLSTATGVISVVLGGTGVSNYSITGGTCATVNGNSRTLLAGGADACTIDVKFTPLAVGTAIQGTLTVSATPGDSVTATFLGSGT